MDPLPYQYRPLPSPSALRLVEILPEQPDGHIACAILGYPDSRDKPTASYCALSYLWGDPTPRREIYIRGDGGGNHTWHSHFVHDNLYLFLQAIHAKKAFGQRLWIDSLCLNQRDDAEKAQQVPRMGAIYRGASEVLIWLGCNDDDEKALRVIRDWGQNERLENEERSKNDKEEQESAVRGCGISWLSKLCGVLKRRGKGRQGQGGRYDGGGQTGQPTNTDSYEHINRDLENGLIAAPGTEEVEVAFNRIISLPYWNRVWIIQEVVLAGLARVVVGTTSMPADDLYTARHAFMWRNRMRYTIAQRSLDTPSRLIEIRMRGERMTLYSLLRDFGSAESTVPADKVYGMLGLIADPASGELGLGFEVDYGKRADEILWDAALECEPHHEECVHFLNWLAHRLGVVPIPKPHPDLSPPDLESGGIVDTEPSWSEAAICTLQLYIESPRTSITSARCAKAALEAFHGARLFFSLFVQCPPKPSNLAALSTTPSHAVKQLLVPLVPSLYASEDDGGLKRAARIGLALATLAELCPLIVGSPSPWRCAAHWMLSESLREVVDGVQHRTANASYGATVEGWDEETLRKLCGEYGSENGSCDGSAVVLEMERSGLRWVVHTVPTCKNGEGGRGVLAFVSDWEGVMNEFSPQGSPYNELNAAYC